MPFGASIVDSLAAGLLERLLAAAGGFPVRAELADGGVLGAPAERARVTLRFHDRAALLRLLADPELQFGDLYAAGRLSVEGELVPLLTAVFRAGIGSHWLRRLLPRWLLEGIERTDPATSRLSAQHHYDVGNDFYALWLDERMLYTCAYFPSPDHSLEDAQLAKLDHVCRKLALRPGQRVLEAGCGWGALALHMARYYGARVRAYNVSHEQILYAREQAEKQGLADRVEFVEDDYRNAAGRCDAFVSVGMLEHVGPSHYDELGEVIERCLVPEGLGLLHSIGRAREQRLARWTAKRVFPNAHPPTLREMMQVLEPRRFAVLDVENLRLHYELTARHWRTRFERHREAIEQLVGPERARTWHLYLAGTEASFASGSMQLFQVVFSRAGNDRIPWTRSHLYTGAEPLFVAPG